MRVAASSPAKAILFGEHFVVKGAAGVAAAISLRARVKVEEAGNRGVVITSSMGEARINGKPVPGWAEPFKMVLEWLRDRGYSEAPARVVVESDIPPRAGLGSSAAVSAAFALAYTTLHGDPLGVGDLIKAATVGEAAAHGRPSGIDPTVTVLGGIVSFSREEDPMVLRPPRLESVALVIADSGVERSTREAVEKVLTLAEKYWDVMSKLYYAADTLSRRAVKHLSRGDYESVGELMNINHGLLAAIGVSTPRLEELVYTAREAGALGAKITGAGMGGSIVGLTRIEDSGRVLESLKEKAAWARSVEMGVEGTRLEE